MQVCSLSARDIACRRGDRALFRGVTVELTAGDALHITGANGIGKSSLMRIFAGLLRPFVGSVQSNGSMGLLDERPALDPHVTLSDGLRFWNALDTGLEVDETALLLGIEELLDVPFRYLSTGQRKRAAFARLLNQGTDIWLLDEPLNGLDADARERIASLSKLHCDNGGICVIASHQPIHLPDVATLNLEEFIL